MVLCCRFIFSLSPPHSSSSPLPDFFCGGKVRRGNSVKWSVPLMGLEWAFRRRGQSGARVSYWLSSLSCPIYDHNSLQRHYGNWEAIISEPRLKWCLNKKTIMKVKGCKNTAGSDGRRGIKEGEKKHKWWFCIVPTERSDKLSIEFKCNLGCLIIWELLCRRQ